MAANHAIFSDVNPLFGIMTLLVVALVLLAVDYYEVGGVLRRVTGWVAGVGIIVAILGASLYVFVDPSTGGLSYWLYILGMFVLGVAGLAATKGVYSARISKISRTEI
jgi:hypothetical protein